uniref:Uncharacterized protein n=1 Tax=Poecilia reticulata TaxID=8081 RepID=A0A3P9PC01_POERE
LDSKSFGHAVTFHGEDPLLLGNATWEILTNYKKKKNVAKLRLADGSEYLFQCKDEVSFQSADKNNEAPGPSGSKTHSLPTAPSSSAALPEPGSAKKDKEKKFSRFAKKK